MATLRRCSIRRRSPLATRVTRVPRPAEPQQPDGPDDGLGAILLVVSADGEDRGRIRERTGAVKRLAAPLHGTP